ncbi:hypothetical protein Fmac_014705 [Flemingia macrophylla]|uniref:WDR11 first beta-propeller domain-containing protein n=1 Tax=Flemingia macrophylla TaxID=520843 RepID=A0ABD1MCH5_9FABA
MAFPSGSSISIVDTCSIQLLSSLPIPPPPPSSPPSAALLLAAGDCQGRIALLDFRLKSSLLWFHTDSKQGIQDLCWAQARPNSYLAPIQDPFDSRRLCAIALRGFFLSIVLLGDSEDAVVVKEHHIPTDSTELAKLERDAAASAARSSATPSPAVAAFPLYAVKLAFSPQWRYILFVTFPRELVMFDLQYKTVVFSTPLPRGCDKFLDVLPDPSNDWVYCAHLDGHNRLCEAIINYGPHIIDYAGKHNRLCVFPVDILQPSTTVHAVRSRAITMLP